MDIKELYNQTKNLTVLYVEDDKNEAIETKGLLEDFFANVYIQYNGLDALNFYTQYQQDNDCFIDLAITDLIMPKMGGQEMIQKIKKINPNQHIIVISAHGYIENLVNLFQNGIDDFLIKPILSKNLNIALSNCTKKIIKDKEFEFQQILLNEIATFQENILVVLDKDEKIIFFNQKFLAFFSVSSADEFHEKFKRLSYLFIEGEEFFTPNVIGDKKWMKTIEKLDDHQRIVSMIGVNDITPKVFLVNAKQIPTTKHTIICFSEITNITIEKNILKQKAFKDELTEAYNRAYFNEAIKQEYANFQRDNTIFCIVIFDIDYFKKVNDTHGHQVGDKILQELSQLIKKKTRESDILARWGGEEFIKILHDTKLKAAINVAEHLREVIESYSFYNNLNITCSFGVSQVDKNDSIDSLIKKADEALYKAKEGGRNKVEWKK